MTTPTRSPAPSPASMPRRQTPKPARPVAMGAPGPAPGTAAPAPAAPRMLTVEESIAPGKLTKREHFRKYFLFGLRNSRMPAHARLVGHDLMWRASHATGQVSPNMQPTSEHLAIATGLTVGQVDVAVQVLHTRGWLHYRRLKDGPRAGQNAMVLAIPAGALEQIRARASTHHHEISR